jgi:hypothetical protein
MLFQYQKKLAFMAGWIDVGRQGYGICPPHNRPLFYHINWKYAIIHVAV